jgi:hypothetical protein
MLPRCILRANLWEPHNLLRLIPSSVHSCNFLWSAWIISALTLFEQSSCNHRNWAWPLPAGCSLWRIPSGIFTWWWIDFMSQTEGTVCSEFQHSFGCFHMLNRLYDPIRATNTDHPTKLGLGYHNRFYILQIQWLEWIWHFAQSTRASSNLNPKGQSYCEAKGLAHAAAEGPCHQGLWWAQDVCMGQIEWRGLG